MDKCNNLGLTAQEAFDNLYVLFVPNSPAGIYFHKYVLPWVKTIEESIRYALLKI